MYHHLLLYLKIAALRVVDSSVIHFVDRNNHLLYASRKSKKRILVYLTISVKTLLKFTEHCANNEQASVCLGICTVRILDIFEEAWRINN